MTILKHEQLYSEFSEIFQNDYARVLLGNNDNTIICEAINTYIPIEEFISIFNNCAEIIEKKKITKFIFDKRALTSFHQPSMEWYFLTWKKKMLNAGLKSHRKVLPPLPWFRDCVNACKIQMLNSAEHSFLDNIDLKYYESVQECIEN